MVYEPSQKMFKVKNAHGHIFDIPEKNLDAALARDERNRVISDDEFNQQPISPVAPQASPTPNLTNQPEETVFVRDSKGIVKIPKSRLEEAQRRGGVLVNEDTYGKQVARTAKSVIAGGVGDLVDTATSVYNIPATLSNATSDLTKNDDFEVDPISGGVIQREPGERPELPLIPSAEHAIESSIDEATGGYTNTPKEAESAQNAVKRTAGIFTPGKAAKEVAKLGLKGASKVLGALGTTKVPGLVGAGAAGYASSEASQAGYGAAGSIGAGLAAGGAAGATATALKNLNVKLALAKLTGNSPKNIDLDAVRAAEAAGLDFSNTMVNKSKGLALAEQGVLKSPYFGTKYAKKLEGEAKSYAESVEKAIDRVGKKIIDSDSPLEKGDMIKETFENLKSVIKEEDSVLYQTANELLPEGAAIIPNNVIEAIKNVRDRLKTLRASGNEGFVIDYLDGVEKSLFLGSGNGRVALPVPIDLLVGGKRSINDIIDWDIKASGPKKLLKVIQAAYNQDIAEYGKTNAAFYKKFKQADKFHGTYLGDKALGSKTVIRKIFAQQDPEKILPSLNRISDFKNLSRSLGRDKAGQQFSESIKREKLTDLLMGKVIDEKSNTVSYTGFSKAMDSASNKELVKYLAGDKYKDLENLNKYARAAFRRNQRNPNPSGTAATKAVIGTFVGSAGIFNGLATGLESAAAAGLTGSALSWLINNKKPLQWGIEGAKKLAAGDYKQAGTYAQRIERLMKEDLGEDFVRQFIALSSQEPTKEDNKQSNRSVK